MSIHFSSGREIFPEDVWCFTINPTTGNLSAGNYYFSIQGRNRIGLNKPLKSNLIAIPNNSTLTITLKTNIFASGENWFDLILSISQVESLNAFKQILSINLKNDDSTFLPPFPIDLVLDKDEDLEVEKEYCNVNDINDLDFRNGKIIKLITTNKLYEFYKGVFLRNDQINLNNFNTLGGCFKRIFSSNKNITDVEDYGGCNLNIRSDLALLDYFIIPEYQVNNTDSEYLKFTLANDTPNSVPANSIIYITSFLNNQNADSYLQDSIFVIYRGFINLTTGVLRTTDEDDNNLEYLGIPLSYDSKNPNLFLPDDLKPNEGFILDIYIRLNPIILSNVFTNNSGLLIYPTISSNYIRYSPFYEIFTQGAIINRPDYCFLDPQLDGNILVKKGEFVFRGYSIFRNYEEEYYLNSNAEQYLNLTTEGELEAYLITEELPLNSINVGRIKCLAGKSKISNKISINLTSNGSLNFFLNLDVVDNRVCVRNDYPNIDLRNKRISFPSIDLEIYVKKPNNTIVKIPYVINTVARQLVEINTLPLSTIALENINTQDSFGLIDSPLLENGLITSGIVPSGLYEIYCSFSYSGLEVTDILDTLKVFDLNNLGGGTTDNGSNFINYSVTSINSIPNLLLDFKLNLNYKISMVGNCNLENPINYHEGSTINLLIKQDATGNRLLTFGNFWKFTEESLISSFSGAVTLIRGFVTSTGIYCDLVKTYDYIAPSVTQSGQLSNNQQLNNNSQLSN